MVKCQGTWQAVNLDLYPLLAVVKLCPLGCKLFSLLKGLGVCWANDLLCTQSEKHAYIILYTNILCVWVCIVVVQSLSCVWLFSTPWTVAHQSPLSSTVYRVCSNSCMCMVVSSPIESGHFVGNVSVLFLLPINLLFKNWSLKSCYC